MKTAGAYPVITLTTDFGLRDEYVGLMKGVIHGINPVAPVIDLTHYIPPQDVLWTAHLIYYSFSYFPSGSVHVVVVDPGVGSSRKIMLVKAAGHYFLVPDNGLMTKVVAAYGADEIWSINNARYFLDNISSTFHGRDIFAPVAAYLSTGVEPMVLGIRETELYTLDIPEPDFTGKAIQGAVIHVDQFGNLITNIEREQLRRLSVRYPELIIEIGAHQLTGIAKSYLKVDKHQVVATIGSKGLLEISVNQGNAAEQLGFDKGEPVQVHN